MDRLAARTRLRRADLRAGDLTPLYTSLVLGYTAFDSGMLLMRALPVVVLTPVFATMAERGADVRYLLGTGFALTAVRSLTSRCT